MVLLRHKDSKASPLSNQDWVTAVRAWNEGQTSRPSATTAVISNHTTPGRRANSSRVCYGEDFLATLTRDSGFVRRWGTGFGSLVAERHEEVSAELFGEFALQERLHEDLEAVKVNVLKKKKKTVPKNKSVLLVTRSCSRLEGFKGTQMIFKTNGGLFEREGFESDLYQKFLLQISFSERCLVWFRLWASEELFQRLSAYVCFHRTLRLPDCLILLVVNCCLQETHSRWYNISLFVWIDHYSYQN